MARVLWDWDAHEKIVSERSIRRALKDEAEDRARRARALLAPHRKTGQAKIEVSQGTVDSFVSLVHPAALSIEFGHRASGRYKGGRDPKGLRIISRIS